jgi:hypothetical protein
MGQVLTVPPWHELYFQCGVTEGCLTGGHYYDEAQVLHPPLDLGLAETICENLNIVSPTPFMITLVFLLVAWLVWRRSGKAEQEALAWEGMEAANRCDGCKVTFHNFYGLARVEGKEGYFCENCRTAMAKAPAAATDE